MNDVRSPQEISTAAQNSEQQLDVAQVVVIAREASQLALEWSGRCAAQIKVDNTLVTEADVAIENLLRQRLKDLAPTYNFLGEEGGLVVPEGGSEDAPCWVIDPIDGTTNFVRGVPLWCVSIGLVHQGRAILGVVSVPPQNEMLWASAGKGAFWQAGAGEAIPLRARDPEVLIQEDLIACNTSVEEAIDFVGVPCRLRNFGTLAYHLTLLARGVVCSSLAMWHQVYDVAAGICLCQEAGCIAQYLDGRAWIAERTRRAERIPLMVAAPNTLKVLAEHLQIRSVPLQRGKQSLEVPSATNDVDASDI